jgi:hypothetical protein
LITRGRSLLRTQPLILGFRIVEAIIYYISRLMAIFCLGVVSEARQAPAALHSGHKNINPVATSGTLNVPK